MIEKKVISDKVFDDRMNLLREASAAVRVAEAKVRSAELDLSFAEIKAPISGRISRTLVTAGNWISAGNVSGATLLTTIVSQNPVFLYFDVSENNYIKYKRLAERGIAGNASEVGASIQIALPDEKGFPHKATLNFLDIRARSGHGHFARPARWSRTTRASSPGHVRPRARGRFPGLYGPTAAGKLHRDGPDFALRTGCRGDGTVERRNVTLGPYIDGRMRTVREGVKADDWVITNGIQRARPGNKVMPKQVNLTLSEAPTPPSSVTTK